MQKQIAANSTSTKSTPKVTYTNNYSKKTVETPVADRAAGVLVGQACGDALGVPYEFAKPLKEDDVPEMIGGGLGPYRPGEYSDDTQMAVCIAVEASRGKGLLTHEAQRNIARNFLYWMLMDASDVGAQTRTVLLRAALSDGEITTRMRSAAAKFSSNNKLAAGNGALMRTSPVALAHLGDDQSIVKAAKAVANLTHFDPLVEDSCVLWSIAIDRAVRLAKFEIRDGLQYIPATRRDQWVEWLDEAESTDLATFTPNGFTVTALQAAWGAIYQTPVPELDPPNRSFPCLHLQHTLENAIRIGDDTDTVAAIAGSLLGARWGYSAIPYYWRRIVHGVGHVRARDLARYAIMAVNKGQTDYKGWPTADHMKYHNSKKFITTHPSDEYVLLSTSEAALEAVGSYDAAVTLLRLGRDDVPYEKVLPENHIEVWLVDSTDPKQNPNLEFVLDDAAWAVYALRMEAHTVLLHCVEAQSRTPSVASAYAWALGDDPNDVVEFLFKQTGHRPNVTLQAGLDRLHATVEAEWHGSTEPVST